MKLILTTNNAHAAIAEGIAHRLGHHVKARSLLGPATSNNVVIAAAGLGATTAVVVLGAGASVSDPEATEAARVAEYVRDASARGFQIVWRVVVAVADVESWLFADRAGLEQGLRGHTDGSLAWNAPETIVDPKSTLNLHFAPPELSARRG